jgi:hypothetical protein
MRDAGLRTVVDLREATQRAAEPSEPPAALGFDVRVVPIEEGLEGDPVFDGWIASGWLATPLYYAGFLERWPDRMAAAVRAVATEQEGGVLVHCRKGSDRTGLVVLVLLALAGVEPDDIVGDHLETRSRSASPEAAALGWEDDTAVIDAVLEAAGTTAEACLRQTIDGFDAARWLTAAGLTDAELDRARRILTDDGDAGRRHTKLTSQR